MKKQALICSMAAVLALGAVPALGAEGTLTGTQKVVVSAEDWGPAVTKTILTLDAEVDPDSIRAEDFSVTEEREFYVDFETFATGVVSFERTVLAVYPCDEEGNEAADASNCIAIEMAVSPSEGSPFIYKLENGRNTWSEPYNLTVSLSEDSVLTAGGEAVAGLSVEEAVDVEGNQKIAPALEGWDLSGKFTSSDGTEFRYAQYIPAENEGSNALVIWLHGGGECGEDPQITILANKVTALSSEAFQSLFEGGAYVLAPQCPAGHHWCNGSEGETIEGVETYGDGESIFLESLFELIDAYVTENEDIDPAKILIGGCSAGGYMTMAQIFAHPDYFAAAFPISEAYYSVYVPDEMVEAVKDVPIWFTNARNDSINPELATNPLFERIQAAGNEDIHHSEFEDVHDPSGLYFNEDGSPYQYNGHWSWIYFDNNECTENELNEWQWLADHVT